LGERCRPRDLYDVINLYRNNQLPASTVVRDVLSEKCDYKNINVPALADMDRFREPLERNWEPMLAHQLPALPSLEIYINALPELFSWLEGVHKTTTAALSPISIDGEVYQPVYGHLSLQTSNGNSLEIIRFAAGNRLWVELDYTANTGTISTRIIEPYSLRETHNGNIMLYAVRVADGQIRAYSIDRINGSSLTNQVFTPRYRVVLTPTQAI
jgi:hypothetical protein